MALQLFQHHLLSNPSFPYRYKMLHLPYNKFPWELDLVLDFLYNYIKLFLLNFSLGQYCAQQGFLILDRKYILIKAMR